MTNISNSDTLSYSGKLAIINIESRCTATDSHGVNSKSMIHMLLSKRCSHLRTLSVRTSLGHKCQSLQSTAGEMWLLDVDWMPQFPGQTQCSRRRLYEPLTFNAHSLNKACLKAGKYLEWLWVLGQGLWEHTSHCKEIPLPHLGRYIIPLWMCFFKIKPTYPPRSATSLIFSKHSFHNSKAVNGFS